VKNFNIFLNFVESKRRFFLWFLSCFAVDRITTYIVLTFGWFGESNPIALLMWSTLGYVLSELLSMLLVIAIFFYVGVFGSDLAKKYVLPGICLIYTYMIIGNIAAVILGATGNFEVIKYVGLQNFSLMGWYVYCWILSVASILVIYLFCKMKGWKNPRRGQENVNNRS